jgi:hypothetical protein
MPTLPRMKLEVLKSQVDIIVIIVTLWSSVLILGMVHIFGSEVCDIELIYLSMTGIDTTVTMYGHISLT